MNEGRPGGRSTLVCTLAMASPPQGLGDVFRHGVLRAVEPRGFYRRPVLALVFGWPRSLMTGNGSTCSNNKLLTATRDSDRSCSISRLGDVRSMIGSIRFCSYYQIVNVLYGAVTLVIA
jgi:hypothetical protein